MDLFYLAISATFVNNILLAQYLGNCPFLGVSKKLETAMGMAAAIVFVTILASIFTWSVFTYVLQPYNLEFLKTLTSQPKVIVTTAYEEFALEGYELNISDYLLKPFGFERFLKAINKTVSATNKTTQSIVDNNDAVSKSIFLRSNNKYIQVTIDTIQYIEAAGNYTKVITINETITIREKISDVLELLNDIDFIQVHKSFAVSKKHIKSIEGNRIFISENIIPIGKTYKANIIQLLK